MAVIWVEDDMPKEKDSFVRIAPAARNWLRDHCKKNGLIMGALVTRLVLRLKAREESKKRKAAK